MADLEAQQNGTHEETKVLTEEKVPVVKVTSPVKEAVAEFKGLSKAELMKYADDPTWVRIRWVLFILFWLIWVGMLVASIVIIVFAPKCPSPEPKEWWQKGPVYKVDIPAFNKDIKGLESELEYLVDTGVTTLYLSAFFKGSGLAGGQYGVSDYKDVAPELGSLADWDNLAKQLKERKMKVIVDFIPDATSTMHEWFERSVAKEPEFEDFYIWTDNAGSGWEQSNDRAQAYYVGGQTFPQLNLRNQKVVAELESVLRFWMERGVDGFNLVGYNTLVETTDFQGTDEAASDALVRQFRRVIDDNTLETAEEKIIMTLTNRKLVDTIPLYGQNISEAHVGDLFHLVGSQPLTSAINILGSVGSSLAESFVQYVKSMQAVVATHAWPTLSISAVDSRVDSNMVDAINMLSMILPATPFNNFGDELGQFAGDMNWAARDAQRNVTNAPTHLSVYAKASKVLRHQKTILFGDIEVINMDGVLVVARVKKGNPGYLLLINFNDAEASRDISAVHNIAENIKLEARSVEVGKVAVVEGEAEAVEETSFATKAVKLMGWEAKLFTFVPKF